MSADASRIVNKLWSYCNVLRDDGLSYGDNLEQHYRALLEHLSRQHGLLDLVEKDRRWT